MVAVVMAACINEDGGAEYSLAVGDALPAFSVVMSDGTLSGSRELAGKTAVITFFHTECPDCQRELPAVQAVYEQSVAAGADVSFVCIAREELDPAIADYWTANRLTLPYSPQPDRSVYSLFASGGIPRIYVVSPDSKIKAVFTDTDAPTASALAAAIAE